jgi:carotenoid cleavage dioxygenase
MTAAIQTQDSPAAATAPRPAIESPYLQGNYAPVTREHSLGELRVRGALPPELSGVLMRTGPNPAGPVSETHQWFVGDGMLHAVEIVAGRATGYRNRFVRTARVQEVLGLPAAPVSPHQPFTQGSGAVNVIRHAGRILALGEVGLPYEMSRGLDTLGQYDYAAALRSNMTAHPKLDPVTGELFFFGYDFGEVPLRYHVAGASGALGRTLELKTPQTTMMHDFGVTATRAVFMDLPVVFDLSLVERGYGIPFRWDASYGARVGVMRRDGDGSDLRWIEIPPCFVYHPFNAYDDGERIVMDVVEHERTFDDVELNGPSSMAPPRCVRWLIDPARGTLERSVLDERGEEFPRIDPRRACRPHRYGYGVRTAFGAALEFRGLFKRDFAAGTTEEHELPAGCAASEGVFVPVGPAEDEGYVIAPVYDAARNASEIRVIDARRFAAAPVATIELPVRIPFGFHGDFFADV